MTTLKQKIKKLISVIKFVKNKKPLKLINGFLLVERGGFEPPKSRTADLQSAPFGHSGTSP